MQPGDTFVYYGEELGMSGTGKDENFRAPMLWTDDVDAAGMTVGPPGMEPQDNSFPPAVQQVSDPDSIYSYIRDALHLRRKYPQIGRGSIEVMQIEADDRAGAVIRSWQGSDIIMVFNVGSDLVELKVQGTLQDHLSATGKVPEKNGDIISIPEFTIAILVLEQ